MIARWSHESARGRSSVSVPAWPLLRLVAVSVSLVATACGAGSSPGEDAAAAPGMLELSQAAKAFVGASIYDGTGAPVIEDGVLVVDAGKVVAVGPRSTVNVPAGVEVVDLGGRWMVPGFINSHGHVNPGRDDAELTLYARYGITTVVSLGGERERAFQLRNEQDTPNLTRARIFVAGPVLNPASAEAAAQDVAEVAAMGADWVKIRVDDNLDTRPAMAPEVYRAVIDAARQAGMRVAAHIVDLEHAKDLVRSGVALIAHSVRDAAVDDELITMMRERNVCLVPTFTREVSTFVYADRPDFFDDPFFLAYADSAEIRRLENPEQQARVRSSASAQFFRNALPLAQENMRRMHEAGVGVAMGTDTGPAGRFQGFFEHLEMELMVEAGLTPSEVLYASTGGAARCMGLEGLGTLTPGAWADFVVLDADPTVDILNTRKIHGVWIAGNQIER